MIDELVSGSMPTPRLLPQLGGHKTAMSTWADFIARVGLSAEWH